MPATLFQLAEMVRGQVIGDGGVEVAHARPLSEAGPGDITFAEGEKYAKQLMRSNATAAIVAPSWPGWANGKAPLPLIAVADPLGAFVRVLAHFRGEASGRFVGIHPNAWVAASARIGRDAAIHPFAYVGEEVELGEGCIVHAGAVIRERCRIGPGSVIHPRAVLYPEVTLGSRVVIHAGAVLGGDGFGYRTHEGIHVKVPQSGTVRIGDDVEVGCNTTIDRGTFEATEIGSGTKVDNLVMIGHNNRIGRHNLLCGQVGLAGSCTTGDHVVMAGQAGIKDHVRIGDKAVVGAQAGVHRDVPPGEQVLGAPAIPGREQAKIMAATLRLPAMRRQLIELTAAVAKLSALAGLASQPDDDPTGF